jgi:hypothetical protein
MNPEDIELIHRYLDGQIAADEIECLECRLRESVELRQTLVQASLLDDQLGQVLAKGSEHEHQNDAIGLAGSPAKTKVRPAPSRRIVAFVAGSILLLVGLLLLSNRNQLSASQELSRILKSLSKGDRHYSINVEETVLPSRKQREKYDSTRPPKPTLEGAKLYVRGIDQFVLMRFRDDAVFVTGSDGQIGWAIAPSGPVRISRDTQRFNRDLPGHEHSIPLGNLSQGLEQIQKAYKVEIVTATPSEQLGEQEAMLIAIKKPGERGPKRIEIQYGKQSGRIAQIRFIEMPYGPDRLTVRLTLTDELSLPSPFFHHSHHQASDREVIDEDKEQE